jgi:UDP-N-acetylmuramoylalanine-D-glutamate ligase
MRLMLKYKEVAGLGESAQDLLDFSRTLRTLDSVLRDPARCAVVLVSLDEPVVRAETERLAAELAPLAEAGVPLRRAADLEDAVRAAAAAAAPGEVVLLSPACASFDAFPNFEARGERFRQIARALEAERG